LPSINLVIYAPNVHQGGGKALLLPLLEELKDKGNILFILDKRLQLPEGLALLGKVVWVRATLVSRLLLECRLKFLIKAEMELLCLGNLPPLLASRGKQIVLIQNRYLIDDAPLSHFPLSIRIRIFFERWWLYSRKYYVKYFVVQTPIMQQLVQKTLGREAHVLPFATLPSKKEDIHDFNSKKKYDFIYVASGEPHKNHRQLILAWIELAKKKDFPDLCLTLDEKCFPQLCSWVFSMVDKHHLHVTMAGKLSEIEIQHLYQTSRALIYPSLLESLGLPMLEAVSAGLPVLAADTDYVRNVVHPTAVFNPYSSQSIAQAVLDFSYEPASFAIDLLNAKEFLSAVFIKDSE